MVAWPAFWCTCACVAGVQDMVQAHLSLLLRQAIRAALLCAGIM